MICFAKEEPWLLRFSKVRRKDKRDQKDLGPETLRSSGVPQFQVLNIFTYHSFGGWFLCLQWGEEDGRRFLRTLSSTRRALGFILTEIGMGDLGILR